MTENLVTSDQELFEEICAKGLASAVITQEAFNELVDDAIEEHRELAELADDQDLVGDAAGIKARWPEYQARLSETAN